MRSVLRKLLIILAGLALTGCSNIAGGTGPAPAATAAAPVSTVAADTPVAPTAASPTTAPPTAAPPPTTVVEATATTAAPPTAAPTIAPPTAAPPTVTPAPVFACTPGALTPSQTEGPYYSENPPEDVSLFEPGMSGTRLTLTGYVLDAECQPVPGARVDFWQADAAGEYDNQGYTLRGYQLTDAEGRYTVETVIPGLYPGRTRHIHVKVAAPNGPILTTQLYFPGEAANAQDRIFAEQNVVRLEETAEGAAGTFNFVIDAS